MISVARDRLLAFRLAGHHLDRRLAEGSLVEAVAACGIQASPPAAGATSLVARIDGLTPAALQRALNEEKTITVAWSVRAAPHVVPTRELMVFGLGALPSDEDSFHVFLQGGASTAAVEASGFAAADALDRVTRAMRRALRSRAMEKGELSTRVTLLVPETLTPWCPKCLANHVPEMLFRAAGIAGGVCFTGSDVDNTRLDRIDRWIGEIPAVSAPDARAELARRFLRCFGPSTPELFAEWALLAGGDARDAFASIEDELVEVRASDRASLLLARDLAVLESPPEPSGARLLPANDPYVQQPDRSTLLPDAAHRRILERSAPAAGVVLVAARPVAVWRQRKARARLQISVEPFSRVAGPDRKAIEAEAERLAPFRDCSSASVSFAG